MRFPDGDGIEQILSRRYYLNSNHTDGYVKSTFTMTKKLSPSQQRRLSGYQEEYRQLKKELQQVGHVLQGSVTKRWVECGKASCRCHTDPQLRHGPYYQWSWKTKGKTSSVYLNEEQADLCKEWITNHRELEQIVKRMRNLSLRIAGLYNIPQK